MVLVRNQHAHCTVLVILCQTNRPIWGTVPIQLTINQSDLPISTMGIVGGECSIPKIAM